MRLIGKWLNAGVLEDGALTRPGEGTPQGGVISPLLANVYLHYVLDEWFEREVRPRLIGRAYLVRYADDFIMGFELEEDARRVLAVLPKRFERYGLTLHPEKTRLVAFQRPNRPPDGGSGSGPKPETFDLLGFTHYWAKSRKGYWVVKQKTARKRFTRALKRVAEWCRMNRHRPIAEQHEKLSVKLRGHYAYYGITGNSFTLTRFRKEVTLVWRRWLSRRRRAGQVGWDWFTRVLARYPLPQAISVHSAYRLAAKP